MEKAKKKTNLIPVSFEFELIIYKFAFPFSPQFIFLNFNFLMKGFTLGFLMSKYHALQIYIELGEFAQHTFPISDSADIFQR